MDKKEKESIKKYEILYEKYLERRKKKYHENLDSGKCPKCGKTKRKNYKYLYCIECRSVADNCYNKYKKKINKKRRDVYAERKENGQCPRCGERLPKKYTKVRCPACVEKSKN